MTTTTSHFVTTTNRYAVIFLLISCSFLNYSTFAFSTSLVKAVRVNNSSNNNPAPTAFITKKEKSSSSLQVSSNVEDEGIMSEGDDSTQEKKKEIFSLANIR